MPRKFKRTPLEDKQRRVVRTRVVIFREAIISWHVLIGALTLPDER